MDARRQLMVTALVLAVTGCQRLPIPDFTGAESALWEPAPEQQLAPDTTELALLVREIACASGQTAEGRVVARTVEMTATTVAIEVGVRPRQGDQNCQGNPPTPFTFVLDEPLGDRDLVMVTDGQTLPPTIEQ